jgi:hypothetical protein
MQNDAKKHKKRGTEGLTMTRNHQFIEFIPRLPVLATVPAVADPGHHPASWL